MNVSRGEIDKLKNVLPKSFADWLTPLQDEKERRERRVKKLFHRRSGVGIQNQKLR